MGVEWSTNRAKDNNYSSFAIHFGREVEQCCCSLRKRNVCASKQPKQSTTCFVYQSKQLVGKSLSHLLDTYKKKDGQGCVFALASHPNGYCYHSKRDKQRPTLLNITPGISVLQLPLGNTSKRGIHGSQLPGSTVPRRFCQYPVDQPVTDQQIKK